MTRRIQLPSKELGELSLLGIWEKGGVWEEEWEPLRQTAIGKLFSSVSQGTWDNALFGLTRPLATQLGLPPYGALRKLPPHARTCGKSKSCVFFDAQTCFPTTTKLMPWCYEPSGISDEKVRSAAAKAIELWREGVYLVIVKEEA